MAHERIIALALLLASGCGDGEPSLGESVTAAMDPTVDPCQDFYQYACGGWLREIGDLQASRYARGFDALANANLGTLQEIMEEGDDFTLSAFYSACTDEARAESTGRAPLEELLAQIAALDDRGKVMTTAAKLHLLQIPVLFDLYVSPSLHDPTHSIMTVGQGGFALPDRDFYLSTDERSRALLDAYQSHVGAMLELAGLTSSAAADVVALETELAASSTTTVVLRVAENTDHPLDPAELAALAPIPWSALWTELEVDVPSEVNVDTPAHTAKVAELVMNVPLSTLRAYFAWMLLHELSAHLPGGFSDETHAFRVLLYGPAAKQPRAAMCSATTSWALPDHLGREFVARQFEDRDLEFAASVLDRVERALRAGLESSSWLDQLTRAGATEKIDLILDQVGHPLLWSTPGDLQLSSGHLENVLRFLRSKSRARFGSAGKEIDRNSWSSAAWTVNAFYSASRNSVQFPAGILQPPFFAGDDSVPLSFGSMGSIMGHELTHSLDDQGRKFTGDGTFRDWWTEDSIAEFDRRAECIVDRDSSFEVQPGVFVDGRLTIGESIADLGGVKYAHRAFEVWVAEEGEPDQLDGVDDLTPEQLFFVAFAQGNCTYVSDETARVRALIDVHAPPELRTNGSLSQLPEFHDAFSCGAGTPMHPEQTCEVW